MNECLHRFSREMISLSLSLISSRSDIPSIMIMTRQDDKEKHIHIYFYACLNLFSIKPLVKKILRWFKLSFCLSIFIHHHPILRSCVTTFYYIETNIHTKCHQETEREKNILESWKVIRRKWSIVDLIHKIDDLSKKKKKNGFLPINLLLLYVNII